VVRGDLRGEGGEGGGGGGTAKNLIALLVSERNAPQGTRFLQKEAGTRSDQSLKGFYDKIDFPGSVFSAQVLRGSQVHPSRITRLTPPAWA
jgi:hypothetical protein